VNLVESFESYGDVAENAIQSAPAGQEILVGYRHETWVHDSTFKTTIQIEILDQGNNRVAINQDKEDQVVDADGPTMWEGAMGFLADWRPGEYTAEVVIRDDVTGLTSEPGTGTFEITEPEPKLEIIRAERFSGEYDSGVRGVAKNVSEQELSYAEVSAVFLDDDGRQLGDALDNTNDLAPGREWKFELNYLGEERFSSYELSLDWSVV
jgi:hypothetical protein